ncbi:hypothetical protein AC480_02940 [miscellaneous Crenarchaeota group archaeon SMTZ1-55]|nr:MAG: hypothetical protein AC480_02940 [miscellaneous Crenarchaeota group archaeon SMTZ1-55]
MVYDLAVINGQVVDGAGNPGYQANIYVEDGRISKICRTKLGAETVLDAKGLIVAPGFIDIHQHSDYTVFANPSCDSYIHQGVTTANVGNCGLSLAPLTDEHRDDIIKFNEAFTFGMTVPYDWTSFPEYLDKLDSISLGLNLWPQVGHCTLRAAVMGYEARKSSETELNAMKALLEDAMLSGAYAMSTGAYAPAYWADTAEIIELAKIVVKHGGLYTTHLRRFGFDEAIQIGEHAAIPVEVAHYHGKGVKEARARGLDITYNAYPYTAGSSFLGQILPFELYEGGVDSMLERIQNTGTRDTIRKNPRIRTLSVDTRQNWRRQLISFLPNARSKQYEGRSIGEIATSEAIDPVDWVCDTLLDNDGVGMYIHLNGRNEAYVYHTLQDPNEHVMSDGWAFAPQGPLRVGKPHPRCYGTYPRILGWYVRECEVVSLQEAVRKMTSAPAQKMGLWDRGLLRTGMWADITVFNPNTIIDHATFDDPHRHPSGIEYVVINGQLVISHGAHTGILAGRVLRKTKT